MRIDPGSIRLETTGAGGRYSLSFEDGSEAELDYVQRQPGVVVITHTGTPVRHRGQGVAAVMVARAVKDFRAAGQKVIPACWYAREQFRQNPDWADLIFNSDGATR